MTQTITEGHTYHTIGDEIDIYGVVIDIQQGDNGLDVDMRQLSTGDIYGVCTADNIFVEVAAESLKPLEAAQ